MSSYITTDDYLTASKTLGFTVASPHNGKLSRKITIAETSSGKIVLRNAVTENSVFVVQKNADFTEGRGPMLLHKIFRNLESAVSYVMSQEGIFGSRQWLELRSGVTIHGEVFVYTSFNGYNIEVTEICD